MDSLQLGGDCVENRIVWYAEWYHNSVVAETNVERVCMTWVYTNRSNERTGDHHNRIEWETECSALFPL